jgi:hypothetical protein
MDDGVDRGEVGGIGHACDYSLIDLKLQGAAV